MEEANRFLPGADGYKADCRGRKKRLDVDGDDKQVEGRSSKQMAADGEDSEEAAAREMLDKLMLNGDDEPILADDMQELRAAMDMAKTPPGRPAGTREDPDQQQQAVDLHSMLIRCADAVADNDRRRAADLLQRIRHHSSPSGNATQRLAHCFAKGLQVRLNGTENLHYRASSLMPKSASSSSGVQIKAMQFFMATCCFLPVNILFSNKSIYKAAAGRKKLHIVQYGLDHGLQWATLLRWLACREGGPPEVRLTSIDVPQPGFRPARLIEEAGRRLTACARQLGVPFRFRGIAAKSEAVHAGDLDIDPDEVLAVSSLFHFMTLTDEDTMATDDGEAGTDPIGAVLGAIREMKPSVFVHAVLNASYSTAFSATRTPSCST
ncbi:scarecrow-like protein 14 [Miscanthus floridulus]|uniref:scarecrow-like protein 14 n=1 Tax=Miscanthus floridulus TaxID=154761 RepID=UPI00345781C0